MINFSVSPDVYRHWKLHIDGPVARLVLDVDENAGLFPGYELKLNSYDLGVDIELDDAVQRLRFEHPQVKTVVISSAKERVFCAGANIKMLAGASHAHKVNFCKFTNETRNAIEDASHFSGQRYICAINGTAAGGGYEMALACEEIYMTDDGSAAVSLPEVPLLAVLPGTGGLTRVTDKRKVRRDLADYFSTLEEGVGGERAVKWRLVDAVVPNSQFDAFISEKAAQGVKKSDRPENATGVALGPLKMDTTQQGLRWEHVDLIIDEHQRTATLSVHGPRDTTLPDPDTADDRLWLLAAARQLDQCLLHLRFNEPDISTIVIKTDGNCDNVLTHDAWLHDHSDHWLVREIALYWRRVLKRLDLTARSLVACIEPGSCFAGVLAELAFAADRSYMLIEQFEGDNRPPATLTLSASNIGGFAMCNGLTRLETRFLGDRAALEQCRQILATALEAEQAEEAGLVTFAFDDIDWEDELRIFLEERSSFSADALTGLEANLRFAGPETMESKIFGRLTAWQNWIFQRPNAVGDDGALKRYGTGKRPVFDTTRT